MKKVIICFCICLFSIFSSCEPIPALLEFSIVNNSADTIGYTVYSHSIKDRNNDAVSYLRKGELFFPSDTIDSFIQHYGLDDTWGSFFKYQKIDTLYICISRKLYERDGNKLPNDSNVLKIYKISDDNFDMNQFKPLFVYP